MISISLCMIVKNEEATIGRCLESVKDLVDEIIIVDTGSDDKTKDIVRKYTDKLYDFTWIEDFAAARNNSFSFATKEYILWLDADDELLEPDRVKLKQLKETLDPTVASVMMRYNYAFDEYGNVALSFFRERLVKRSNNPKWIDPIHEFISIEGKIFETDICVTHKRVHDSNDRNIKIFEKMLADGKEFSARNLFYYAKELYYHSRHQEAITFFEKFLESGEGWVEDNIRACYILAECYREIKDKPNSLRILLKSFEFGLPRAELCCQLGLHYMNEEDYQNAIFWYEIATKLKKPENTWGFILEEYWGFKPNIQLCVCHYRVGNIEESIKFNELAALYKPDHPSVQFNRHFFAGMGYKKTKSLKIVQVAPDIYALPPTNYGGIEKIVYEVTEDLVKRGHEVYLYAPKGTRTSAKLIPYEHSDAWNEAAIADFVKRTLPEDIDLIHDHTHYSLIGRLNLPTPTVCTIHCPVNSPVKHPIYLTNRSRTIYGADYGFQVYNGINPHEFQYSDKKDEYLLYLGVLNYSKGTQHALDVAIRTKQKLIVAGPVHDQWFFDQEIAPRLNKNPNIVYIGAVGGQVRQGLLKNAKCVLFPTSFEEPFGLVMVEAMICGTPVLALRNGAVPEVLRGFPELICDSVDEMVEKVQNLSLPKPEELQKYVMENFTVKTMVDNYVKVYHQVLADKKVLRIVQVSPDYLPVPPPNYGGIERVVYDLTEELVKRGHEVYLFAPEGSQSSAQIIPYQHQGINPQQILEFLKRNLPGKIDIIHDHCHGSVVACANLDTPTIGTIHTPDIREFENRVFVSKRALQFYGQDKGFFVYNGIEPKDYQYQEEKEEYLLYIGMLAWYKGIVHVLEVAERTGLKLVMAGPIYDMDYYHKEIEPMIQRNPNVTYLGAVGGQERQNLFKNAKCMLFPTVIEEPFGLVMIEAMACGTPVLAFSNGAVPEVLQGFPDLVCSSVDEMTEKVLKGSFPAPKELREYVVSNFSRSKMCEDYLKLYRQVLSKD